jgi:hypothetical protein
LSKEIRLVHFIPRDTTTGRAPAWMNRIRTTGSIGLLFGSLLFTAPVQRSGAREPGRAGPPVAATIETTLITAHGQARQFAFDGDPTTFFASAEDPGRDDHFTLVLDRPVEVHSIEITTGRADGGDEHVGGSMETSADGKTFHHRAKFVAGKCESGPVGGPVQAVRIKLGSELKHKVAIREIRIASDPPVEHFKHPVEFRIDVSDAPEMKAWAENAARVCERAYPMINHELRSDGYKPPSWISLKMKKNYRGVAATSGGTITGSVDFFKKHPDDIGAMVHETVHVVQHYRGRGNPGWLVEGVSDYIRFFKFEPGKIGPMRRRDVHYNGSYRTTAAFLKYLTDTYDKEIVLKLNRAMRAGEYREEIFQELTGKKVQELDEEWRKTISH